MFVNHLTIGLVFMRKMRSLEKLPRLFGGCIHLKLTMERLLSHTILTITFIQDGIKKMRHIRWFISMEVVMTPSHHKHLLWEDKSREQSRTEFSNSKLSQRELISL